MTYFPFVMFDINEDMEKIQESLAYNRQLLRTGVVGLTCTEVRIANEDEIKEYGNLIPEDCYLSTTDVYKNGAKNIFVRDATRDAVGVILVRP